MANEQHHENSTTSHGPDDVSSTSNQHNDHTTTLHSPAISINSQESQHIPTHSPKFLQASSRRYEKQKSVESKKSLKMKKDNEDMETTSSHSFDPDAPNALPVFVISPPPIGRQFSTTTAASSEYQKPPRFNCDECCTIL